MAVHESSGETSGPGALWRNLRGRQENVRRNNLLGYLFIAPAMALYLVFKACEKILVERLTREEP